MKFGAIFLIAVLFSSVGVAQQAGDDVVRVKSNLVNIDVIVKDKKGKYVADLKAEDFTIVENGVAQKIEFFDAPLLRNERTSTTTPGAPQPTTPTPAAADQTQTHCPNTPCTTDAQQSELPGGNPNV